MGRALMDSGPPARRPRDRSHGGPSTAATRRRPFGPENAQSTDHCPPQRCCGPHASASPARSARTT
eukprot:3198032-Alexandrium_andersonii.AAC.1